MKDLNKAVHQALEALEKACDAVCSQGCISALGPLEKAEAALRKVLAQMEKRSDQR